MSRESVERAFLARGVSEDETFSLLTLAETYGTVVIPVFEGSDDAWGLHYSLSLTHRGGSWIIDIESRPHW